MKKRFLAAMLVSIMSLTILAACGNKEEDDVGGDNSVSDPTTLVVMGRASDLSRPYMEVAFKNYEEQTGNKLDLQGIPSENFEQVSLTKFNTGDIPDILLSFGNRNLEPYNPEENFVDFSDATWVSDIEDSVYDQAEYNGKIYGLPHWEASATTFVYNKEIFANAGLEVPTTQAEFMDVCEKLSQTGVTPLYIAFKDAWPIFQQVAMDPIFEDKELLAKLNANEITYSDIPEMKSMVEWYVEMANTGYLGDSFATNSWDYGVDALGSEEFAMMLTWDTWLYTDLDAKYEGFADNFGLMPAFMGTIDTGTIEGPNSSLLLANKNSENAQVAQDFINFMADPVNYNLAFDGITTAPSFKSQTTNIATPQYVQASENGILDTAHRSSGVWGDVIGFTQSETARYIQEAMLGTVTVDEALENMDKDRINIARAQQVPGF